MELKKQTTAVTKLIKPGNSKNYPKKGEYLKLNLKIYDKNGKMYFDSDKVEGVTIRYQEDNHVLNDFEDLIGKMSLNERMTLELTSDMCSRNDFLKACYKANNPIVFDVEITHISKFPYKV